MTVSRKEPSISTSIFGYITSLMMTLVAYLCVVNNYAKGWQLAAIISVLAVLQLVVQFRYFLHVDLSKKSRGNTMILWLTVAMIGILVFGSIWIMNNLNYHMGDSQKSSDYILKDELISN